MQPHSLETRLEELYISALEHPFGLTQEIQLWKNEHLFWIPWRGKTERLVNLISSPTRRVEMDAVIPVISRTVHKGTGLLCLIWELIFHFIADLSISNNTNDLICMTGFVTGQI